MLVPHNLICFGAFIENEHFICVLSIFQHASEVLIENGMPSLAISITTCSRQPTSSRNEERNPKAPQSAAIVVVRHSSSSRRRPGVGLTPLLFLVCKQFSRFPFFGFACRVDCTWAEPSSFLGQPHARMKSAWMWGATRKPQQPS